MELHCSHIVGRIILLVRETAAAPGGRRGVAGWGNGETRGISPFPAPSFSAPDLRPYDSLMVMLLIASRCVGVDVSPLRLRRTAALARASSTSSPPVSFPKMV